MRVISVKTLKNYGILYPLANQSLLAWYEDFESVQWGNHNDLKERYRNASIIDSKRVVFNIHGNSYRLIVDIEYKFQIAFVIWFGTHKDYDKLEIKKLRYVKTNKN